MLPWAIRTPGRPVQGFGRLLGSVLAARGVKNPESLLNPKECGPLANAGKAAFFLRSSRQVLIAGDYDCDGLCGAAILFRALTECQIPTIVYIPTREEGYGFHSKAVDTALSSGCDLIVTVDCGVTNQETVDYAVQKGIKVIVTDHHHFDKLPKNCLLVHPKDHENPYLSGAGVAYKIIQAMGLPEYPYAQLAAIATMADAVQLTEGNRALVRKGLSQTPLPGIQALLNIANTDLTPETICFQIAPRINAASRMGTPITALNLLITESQSTASNLASKLDRLNTKRKSIVEKAVSICKHQPVVTLDVPAGVIGIIAANLAHSLGVPAAVITPKGKGSARAPEGYSLVEMLKKCPSVLHFGGHDCAAGFEIDPEKFNVFKSEFLNSTTIHPTYLEIDVPLGFIPNPEEVKELEKIGPFGPSNPEPLFLYRGTANVKTFDKCSHISIGPLKGVLFGKDASWYNGKKAAVVGTLHVSDYTGDTEAFIQDIRPDIHINRDFLAHAYQEIAKGKPITETPYWKLAIQVFRELNINGTFDKKNLFDSRTYRRFALERS